MVLQVWLDVETYHEVVAMLEIYASLSEKQLCEQGIYSDGEQRGKNFKKQGRRNRWWRHENTETHMSKVSGWSNMLWLE